jgi:NTP pyrophosphatase (non-canonical NTP hydrolase)
MLAIIQKLLTLSENRIPFLMKYGDRDFYRGSETFVKWIDDEIEEMKEELKTGRRVFLEDELGDIFWDYICLLENLELEGKISKEKVFERAWSKFSERLNPDGTNNGDWMEIKQKQKERLEQEQHEIEKN